MYYSLRFGQHIQKRCTDDNYDNYNKMVYKSHISCILINYNNNNNKKNWKKKKKKRKEA